MPRLPRIRSHNQQPWRLSWTRSRHPGIPGTATSSPRGPGRFRALSRPAPGTAILSAMMRAAHLLLDGEPKIFSDHFASKLAGFESEAQLKVGLERFLAAVAAAAGRETAEVPPL